MCSLLCLLLAFNSAHLPRCFCLPLGVFPLPSSTFSFPSSHTDCVEALRVCYADPRCEALYRGLELCAADAAVSPLGEQVAAECLERRDALLGKHPALSSCKCQRGLRKEEQCLHIYWIVRLMPGQSDLRGGEGMEDKLSGHASRGSSVSSSILEQQVILDPLSTLDLAGPCICLRQTNAAAMNSNITFSRLLHQFKENTFVCH